jgi:predicted TIM-barrel enzyme
MGRVAVSCAAILPRLCYGHGHHGFARSEALRLRSNIRAEHIHLLHNLVCAFGVPLVERPHEEEAYGIKIHVGVDGLRFQAGHALRRTLPFSARCGKRCEMPMIAGTGVSKENVEQFLKVSDSAIVVTGLRKDGKTMNRVDPGASEFMAVVRNS